MRLFKCVNLVATGGRCVHVRSFEMLVCVCVVRCVAVGACIHARMCVARTMRRSLAVVYVLGLPFQVCPRGTAACVRSALLVPSRTSSSKVYLALSSLTRKSNLYVHGVLTCAGCGGAYPSESRLVMGEELTAASLLHRFAYGTDASGMQRPCCTVAPPSHVPCNGRMRVYRQKTSPQFRGGAAEAARGAG